MPSISSGVLVLRRSGLTNGGKMGTSPLNTYGGRGMCSGTGSLGDIFPGVNLARAAFNLVVK
jgi:hypothetical protein